MKLRGIGVLCVVAAVIGGCGGSSKSSSSSSSTASSTSASTAAFTGGTPVKSTDGGFRTLIPRGFTNATSSQRAGALKILYLAFGPRVGRFRVNINVIREPRQGISGIDQIFAAEMTGVKRFQPQAHQFSPESTLTIDGEPARAIDYLNVPAGALLHQRQVFVAHGDSIYSITYTAPPTAYAASLGALGAVTSGWHWT